MKHTKAFQKEYEDGRYIASTGFLRVLRRTDVLCLCLVATVNLNLLPAIAAAGPTVYLLWVLVFLTFVVPQGIVVTEISRACPHEGGPADWTQLYFGKFAGFLNAWCYWVNNVFYIPSLFVFLIGNVQFLIHQGASQNNDYEEITLVVGSFVCLWGVVALSAIGFGASRWISNVGAICTISALALLVGIVTLSPNSGSSSQSILTGHIEFGIAHVTIFGVMCLSMVGSELGTVLGDEIRESRAILPWCVWKSLGIALFFYVVGVSTLLLALPAEKISAVQGLMEVISAMNAGEISDRYVILLGVLLCASVIAGALSWYVGASRMLWHIANRGALPPFFAGLHGRFKTPMVAILFQGILCSLVLVGALIGTSGKQVYLLLLDLTVILQLIPFLLMFAVLFYSSRHRSGLRSHLHRLAGAVGTLAAGLGIFLGFVPSRDVDSVILYQVKLICGVLLFLALGTWLFWSRQRLPRG